MGHGEEVFGELVVPGGDTGEMLELADETLDVIPLPIEPPGEGEPLFAIALGGNFGGRAVVLDMSVSISARI